MFRVLILPFILSRNVRGGGGEEENKNSLFFIFPLILCGNERDVTGDVVGKEEEGKISVF